MKKIYYAILIIFTLLVVSCKDKEEVFVTEIEKRGICAEMDSLLTEVESMLGPANLAFMDSLFFMPFDKYEEIRYHYSPNPTMANRFSFIKQRFNYFWTTIDSLGEDLKYKEGAYSLLDSVHKKADVFFDNVLYFDNEGIKILNKSYRDYANLHWQSYGNSKMEAYTTRSEFHQETLDLMETLFYASAVLKSTLHEFDSLYVRKYDVSNP